MLKPFTPTRLTVVALVASGLFLQSCNNEPAPAVPMEVPAASPRPASLQAVTPDPPLDRSALLAAIARAASDYAAGVARSGTDPLVRRSFDVSVAFGCLGAEPLPVGDAGDGLPRWSWGPDRQTIRLSLDPSDWTRSDLITASAGPVAWEAVEGLWISMPWMTADGCPAVTPDSRASGPVVAAPETVGLAAVFDEGGSRLGRRNGRAYAFTVRAPEESGVVAPREGYRLRVQGRITAFPDGRAIHCRAADVRQRPICVAAVQLDRVSFQTATGETLGEWRPG